MQFKDRIILYFQNIIFFKKLLRLVLLFYISVYFEDFYFL